MRSVVRRRSPRGNSSTRSCCAAAMRGEEARVVGVDAGRAQREHAVGGAPVGVGEQRVVAHASGKRALGHAAQEHAVEVEAEARAPRAP